MDATRRRLLMGAASVPLLASCGGGGSGVGMTGAATALATVPQLPEGLPLLPLPTLPNDTAAPGRFEATLRAAPAQVSYLAGLPTDALAYNGLSPGPTIVTTEGDHVRLRFRNRIPDQPSTIHWHGLPVPADQDGNPMDPVASGTDRDYAFSLPEGCAGSYWYHPHPHLFTAEQVARGLAGAFIVQPRADPLPSGLEDHVLMFTDLRVDAGGRMMGFTPGDMTNGRLGDHVLVNGRRHPQLSTSPGATLRLRLFNATNARSLRLSFDSLPMTLIGTDGGLLAAPVPNLSELLLTPGERAEVVVQMPAVPAHVTLRLLPHDRGWMMGSMPVAMQSALLSLRATGLPRTPVALPSSLRPLQPLGTPLAFKRFELGERMGMMSGAGMMGGGMMGWQFLIDGRAFDPARIDRSSVRGEVEQWEFVNASSMDHPMHIHGTQFQVVETEHAGLRTSAPFLAWKDTVNVPRGAKVRLRVRQDLPGLRLYHCHILEHEVQGMMGVLDVQ